MTDFAEGITAMVLGFICLILGLIFVPMMKSALEYYRAVKKKGEVEAINPQTLNRYSHTPEENMLIGKVKKDDSKTAYNIALSTNMFVIFLPVLWGFIFLIFSFGIFTTGVVWVFKTSPYIAALIYLVILFGTNIIVKRITAYLKVIQAFRIDSIGIFLGKNYIGPIDYLPVNVRTMLIKKELLIRWDDIQEVNFTKTYRCSLIIRVKNGQYYGKGLHAEMFEEVSNLIKKYMKKGSYLVKDYVENMDKNEYYRELADSAISLALRRKR